jgi:hypothetical protein
MAKESKEVIGEASRIEFDEKTGKLYLTFEITNLKYKQDIKANWTKDIEFKIINKQLIHEK